MLDEDRRTAAQAFEALGVEVPDLAEVERAAFVEAQKARLVIYLLGWMGLLSVSELFMGTWLVDYLGRVTEGVAVTAEATLFDRVAVGLVWLRLVSGVVTGVAFIQWVRVVVRHARRFRLKPPGQSGMDFTVESATWAWIIPVIDWFRPYFLMKDLRSVSQPHLLPACEVEEHSVIGGYRDPAVVRERIELAPTPVPLGLWWGLFIAARLSARFLHHHRAGSDDLGSVQRFAYVSLVDGGLWVLAALAAILLVRGILHNRTELYRRLHHWSRVLRDVDA